MCGIITSRSYRRASVTGLSVKIKDGLMKLGADIVGFGNLMELEEKVRIGLPVGISIAIAYPGKVIQGIAELPTSEYCDWYNKLNERLDSVATQGAGLIRKMGYSAIAQTREYVTSREDAMFENETVLPHKTVATRAGIGWIGKCALLITEKYGSAIRISSILTDAPLDTALPINSSLCGDCMLCKEACPAGAVSGVLWETGIHRDEFFDAAKCRKTARERAKLGFGGDITICGKCIAVCPYTRRYTG